MKGRNVGTEDDGGFRVAYLVLGGMVVAGMATLFSFKEDTLTISPFHGWKEVPCRIQKSKVNRVVNQFVDRFAFNAEYSYEIDGSRFSSACLCMRGKQDFHFTHLSERLPLLEKYALGTTHICRVNPKDISEAVLEVSRPYHDSDAFDFYTYLIRNGFRHFGFFLILFGIGTALKAFVPIRRFLLKRKRIMASTFFILAVAWPIFKTGVDGIVCTYREVKATNCYVKVPAKVLYSSLLTHTAGRHVKSHLADIGYEYEVGGQKYEGDRVAIIYNSSSYYKLHRGIVDMFRPGEKLEVFVSPDDPRKSVLIRSNIGDWHIRMGAFALIGICLLIIGVKKFVKAIL